MKCLLRHYNAVNESFIFSLVNVNKSTENYRLTHEFAKLRASRVFRAFTSHVPLCLQAVRVFCKRLKRLGCLTYVSYLPAYVYACRYNLFKSVKL